MQPIKLHRFGDRLKSLRMEMGLTQRDLAALSGLNASVISNLENGKHLGPSPSTVLRICRAIGASAETTNLLATYAKVDRVERTVQEQLPQKTVLLSVALDASIQLDESEQFALAEQLQKFIDYKKKLALWIQL